MSLKGTYSATFNYIESNYRSLLVVSVYPATLFLMVSLLSKFGSLFLLSLFLSGSMAAKSLTIFGTAQSIIVQLTTSYIAALWFTVIAAHMESQTRAQYTPKRVEFWNGLFVFLYGVLFFLMWSIVFFGFIQIMLLYAGTPFGTIRTVTVPWREAGPLLVLMPIAFILYCWIPSVTHVNLPSIARGYRPNLFKEIFQFSRGVQSSLTLRMVGLFCAALAIIAVYSLVLVPPLVGITASFLVVGKPSNSVDFILFQMAMIKASMIADILFTFIWSFIIWAFSVYLVQASWRIEGRTQ